jgi:hypothetical protein
MAKSADWSAIAKEHLEAGEMAEDRFESESVMKDFTISLASSYLNLAEFEHERKIDYAHVQYLVHQFTRGMYLQDNAKLSIADCTWDGVKRKLDGQHLCMARMAFGDKPFKKRVKLVTYKVSSPEEYRTLYIHIQEAKNRTPDHKRAMAGASIPEWEGFASQGHRFVLKGFRYLLFGAETRKSRFSEDEIAQMLRGDVKMLDASVHILEIVKGAKSRSFSPLYRRAVIAAMFVTLTSRWEKKAREFWDSILELDFVGSGDPARTLYLYFNKTIIGGASRLDKKTVPEIDQFNACIAAFREYRLGHKLTRIQRPKSPGRLKL